MKTKSILFALILIPLLFGCDQGDERLLEKAELEASESAKKQVAEENRNREERVNKAEEELKLRHRFYQAVSGTYEGIAKGENGVVYDIRFRIAPSVPPYPGSERIRTIEEVTEELNNLFINVHVTEINGQVAFGCIFEKIRPDMIKGTINLYSANCNRSYELSFFGLIENINSENIPFKSTETSKSIARDLRTGNESELNAFLGRTQVSLGPYFYDFYVSKKVD